MARPPWRPSHDRPPPDVADPEALPSSRGDRRRTGDASRTLAAELFELNDKQLATVPLEPDLKEAVDLGRSITKHGGRRRQMQFVAKYLRTLDTEPIRAALERVCHQHQTAALRTHTVEAWRKRLLSGDTTVFKDLRDQCPDLDVTALSTLVREAEREAHDGRPKRAFRELFRFLWALLST